VSVPEEPAAAVSTLEVKEVKIYIFIYKHCISESRHDPLSIFNNIRFLWLFGRLSVDTQTTTTTTTAAVLHLQLGDDLLLGGVDDADVVDREGRVRDDGEHAGVHLFGHGGSGQHGREDGLEGEGGGDITVCVCVCVEVCVCV